MNFKNWLPLLCSLSLIVAPMTGCKPASRENEDTSSAVSASETADESAVDSAGDAEETPGAVQSTWDTVSTTTVDGLTIVTDGIASGASVTVDASTAAWVWSADRSVDGWNWVRTNAGSATEWAADTAGDAWAVTESAAGDLSLWVQVTTADGVGWLKTEVPAAWKVVKDEAGEVWVWIDDHKVEVGVVAAVTAVVVTGLIVAPEAVGPAVVKGASLGAAKETSDFMIDLWEDRENVDVSGRLNDVSQATFMSIGQSVLTQCGSQVLAGQ